LTDDRAIGQVVVVRKASFSTESADSGLSLTAELTDNFKLQRRQIRIRRDQPHVAGAFKIDLQSRAAATAFGADHHAFAEPGMADALAEFDRSFFLQECG
jgi:hypothetical protein